MVRELLAAGALFVLVTVAASVFQPELTFRGGRAWDAAHYADMTEDFAAGRVPDAKRPFVYRVAVPYVAAQLPFDTIASWSVVSVTANALAFGLLWVWLRAFDVSAGVRLVVLGLSVLPFHSMTRRVFFSPLSTDHVDKVFLLLGLLVLLAVSRRGLTLGRAVALAAIAFAGTLVRETILVLPLCLPFVPGVFASGGKRFGAGAVALVLLPLLAGALAFWLAHAVVGETVGGHYSGHAYEMLMAKSPAGYFYAWCVAFGPLLVLPFLRPGEARRFFEAYPWLGAYVLAFGALAWVGGSSTFRLLQWNGPVVWLLVAVVLGKEWPRLRGKPLALLALALVFVVSQRVFWPILHPGGTTDYWMILTPLTPHPPMFHAMGMGPVETQWRGLLSSLVVFGGLWVALRGGRAGQGGGARAA